MNHIQNLNQIATHILEDIYAHRIHGDYAIKLMFSAVSDSAINTPDFENVMKNHHARWQQDTLDNDIDNIYQLSELNANDSAKFATLQDTLAQCHGEVVVLETNIYRYRDITDFEAASIIADFMDQFNLKG